ncbi:MAG: hypothetical protein V3U30_02265 [Thermoplasmata archaeon]
MTAEVGRAYVKPGTLVRPGPWGRVGRLVIGGLQVSATTLALLYANIFLQPEKAFQINLFVPIYIGISSVIALRWLSYMVNIAFRVTWGGRLYWVLLGLVALTLVLSLALFGAVWAPPFSLLVFLVILYTTGHLGVSHVLAAILATPGCEMRSIPHLIGILRRRDVEEHFCPGAWTQFDEREARRRAQLGG